MQAVAESEVDNSVLSTKWDGGFGPVRCQWKQASADSARKDQGDHIIHDALNLEMNTAFRWQSLVCSDDDLKPAVHGGLHASTQQQTTWLIFQQNSTLSSRPAHTADTSIFSGQDIVQPATGVLPDS